MTKTTTYASILPSTFACCVACIVVVVVQKSILVSCEKYPAFTSVRQQQYPFVIVTRQREAPNGNDEKQQPRMVDLSFSRRSLNFCSNKMKQKTSDDDDDDDNDCLTGNVQKYWRTTASGLRIVDDAIGRGKEWSEEIETVARVRCETQILQSLSSGGQQRERVIFLETSLMDDLVVLSKDGSGVVLLVVCNKKSLSDINYNTTATNTVGDTRRELSGFREPLSGMRVGGRRRVLISPTKNDVKIRFVGPGASDVNDETIIMNLKLEALESPSSFNAILAKTITSGGVPAAILLLFRPLFSPLGLLSFFFFAPLIVKKTVNGFAALELYMDVNADTVYPIKALLDWKLKF